MATDAGAGQSIGAFPSELLNKLHHTSTEAKLISAWAPYWLDHAQIPPPKAGQTSP